jgi:hypothetical protein
MRITGSICAVVGFLGWGLFAPAFAPAMESGKYSPGVDWSQVLFNVSILSVSTGALLGFGLGILLASFLKQQGQERHNPRVQTDAASE